MDARRLLPLSGVLFVVVALVAVIGFAGDVPESTTPGTEVASFYDDEQTRQVIGSFLWVASIPFLVFFAVAIAGFARSAEARTIWGYVVVGGSVMLGAILALLSAIQFAMTDGATNDVSPASLEALNLILGNGWVAFNGALGVMMLGAAGCLLAAIRYRWLGWVALLLGVALFIPFADFIALILSLVWILVVSVVLFRAASSIEPQATVPG
jgi:hypothetical protein